MSEHRVAVGAGLWVGILIAALAAGVARGAESAARYVWWEAEAARETNFPDTSYWEPQNKAETDKLSGGDWLTGDTTESGPVLFAAYEIEVPEATTYHLWVRKFWKHGPFRWRLGDGAWSECTRDCALADSVVIRDKVPVNWVYLAPVRLEAGRHRFRFETTSTGAIAMDCFLLTRDMFVPRGRLKPGETSGKSEPGWFAWEPPADPLRDECPIDLRYLNEKLAGQSGFVRRIEGGFALGDGSPVRFLEKGTINPHAHRAMVDLRARRLSKYGVNLARTGFALQYPLYAKGEMEKFDAYLDRIHYLIHALKQQGIYTWIRLYWKTGQEAFFFDPEWREHFVEYSRKILCTPNPYTGLSIAEDPAVAMVAIQNENNLLFWTFTPANIEPDVKPLMEKRFGQWVAQKYGSIEKALEVWGPENSPLQRSGEAAKDRPADGRLGFYSIGFLTGAPWAANQRNPKRASDQLRFLVESQKGFYAGMVKTFREELGVNNLIACSNWKTADPKTLGVFEHYSYTPGDVICKNIYYDVHYNPRSEHFYAVEVGDTFTPYSSLKPPELPEPFTIAHMGDMPYVVTENNWCRPNPYRAEWPFLFAAYGSMLGADGWSFNGEGDGLWNTTMEVWDVNSPSVLGQLPAAALIYRRGDVREVPVAVTDTLSLDDLYAFKGCSLYGLKGQDALWVSKIGDKEAKAEVYPTRVDPLAFFVGRVKRVITENVSKLETVDLDRYIDREAGEVRSLTGEVTWRFADGVAVIDTPRAQGACGFLKHAGPIELGDIAIESGNEYGSILVVSLDGEPLATSRRILIQAGTQDRTYAYRTEAVKDGNVRIVDTGTYPLMVQRIDAAVTLKGPVREAEALDGNGDPTGDSIPPEATNKGSRIRLPSDRLYTLARR
jgi:hypothetical protein